MAGLDFAGMGWPVGPVKVPTMLALPSRLLLQCATEGRYHMDAALRAGKRVLWRAIPRHGYRPAELKYNARRFADEVMNLTDEPTLPIREMIAWNELDLNSERGDNADDWQELDARYSTLGQFQLGVLSDLRQRMPGVTLHYGAWTPDHDAIGHLRHWIAAANAADVVDFHAYDTLDKIVTQYQTYRAAFPDKRLFLAEWHGKGDLDEERRILQWLADLAVIDPLFDGAAFFIWDWPGAPGWWSTDYDVAHNHEREALFLAPPGSVSAPDPPPVEVPPTPPEAPVSDPFEFWTADAIAAATGCPLGNVEAHWPKIAAQLALCGIADPPVQVVALGTVAIETASTFQPVREAFWLTEDWRAHNLRYYPWYGRGYIQLTWESNYQKYSEGLDSLWGTGAPDIHADLDAALDPDVAAAVLAMFFRDQGVADAARVGDLTEARRLVQGGNAGLDRLVEIAAALNGGIVVPTPGTVTFDPSYPAVLQDDGASCAPTSLTWAMRALGRHPADNWIEQDMLAHGYWNSDVGLLDHTGAGIVQWLQINDPQHYGADGFGLSNWACPISWAELIPEVDPAPPYPLLLGLPSWNLSGGGHWVGIRGVENGRLLLANPATGPTYGHASLSRAQFEARAAGNASIVRVLHPDLVGTPAPTPPPPVDPKPARIRELLAAIKTNAAEIESLIGV